MQGQNDLVEAAGPRGSAAAPLLSLVRPLTRDASENYENKALFQQPRAGAAAPGNDEEDGEIFGQYG